MSSYTEIIDLTKQEDDQSNTSETFNVYLCREPWQPNGICTGKDFEASITTKTKYVSASSIRSTISNVKNNVLTMSKAISKKVKRIYVFLPLAKIGSVVEKDVITLYMFKTGVTSPYAIIGKSCNNEEVTDYFSWEQGDSYDIHVKIPAPQICGLKNLRIIYRQGVIRDIWPGNLGEITADTMLLAMGETFPDIYTRLSTQLIAGTDYVVSYLSRAEGDDYHYLGKFRFETARYTAATVVGCGLVDSVTPEISGDAGAYQLLPEPQAHVNDYWTVQTDDISVPKMQYAGRYRALTSGWVYVGSSLDTDGTDGTVDKYSELPDYNDHLDQLYVVTNDENAGKILHAKGIYLSAGSYWKYCGGLDYTIERFIAGGAGKDYKTYYAGEVERFRWLVNYRGKYAKLKATDFTPWQIGTRIYIAKGIDGDIDSHKLSEADTTDDVSESDKIIRMKIQNYGAVTIDD